jgi:Na+-driven multidrug efflux pump
MLLAAELIFAFAMMGSIDGIGIGSGVAKGIKNAFMLISGGVCVILLGSLWSLGLDGIWFNFVGVNMLTAALGIILLTRVGREIRAKRRTAEETA